MANTNGSFASTSRPDDDDPSANPAPDVGVGQAALNRAAIMRLTAEHAEITWSAVATVSSEHTTLQKSTAGAVITKSAAVDRSRIGVLISPVVRGDVHTWLDLRTAFAAGVGFFLGKLVVDLIRGSLRR